LETPFEYHEKKLGVKIKYLIFDRHFHPNSLKLISYNALNKRIRSESCSEKELRRASLGCDALAVYDSLSQIWKDMLILHFGKPKEEIKKSWFAQHYMADREAFNFYLAYTYGDKVKLDLDVAELYGYQASVLNTVLLMKNNRKQYLKALGCNSVDIWDSLSKDVNAFRDVDHQLPTTKDSLRYKVTKYAKESYPAIYCNHLLVLTPLHHFRLGHPMPLLECIFVLVGICTFYLYLWLVLHLHCQDYT